MEFDEPLCGKGPIFKIPKINWWRVIKWLVAIGVIGMIAWSLYGGKKEIPRQSQASQASQQMAEALQYPLCHKNIVVRRRKTIRRISDNCWTKVKIQRRWEYISVYTNKGDFWIWRSKDYRNGNPPVFFRANANVYVQDFFTSNFFVRSAGNRAKFSIDLR